MERPPDSRDVALGLALNGARAGWAGGRTALLPARVVVRAPLLGAPLRRVARDLAHERALLRERSKVPYAGVATRAVALAIDVAIAHVIVFAGGAVLALVGSLVADVRLDTLARVLAAAAWIVTVGTYFVLFWSTAGQTPGMRLMGLRVMTHRGDHPGVSRSVVRVIGLGLAIVPLFLGFLPVLVDERRRGLHDLLAGTVVVYAGLELSPTPEPAPARAPSQGRGVRFPG